MRVGIHIEADVPDLEWAEEYARDWWGLLGADEDTTPLELDVEVIDTAPQFESLFDPDPFLPRVRAGRPIVDVETSLV